VTGKYYVGKTVKSSRRRWQEHLADVRRKSHKYLHRAIRKYGADAFVVETLVESNDKLNLSDLERLWILALDAQNREVGMNLTSGGEGAPNPPPERREQMRRLMLGNTFRQGWTSWCKGQSLPEAQVEKMKANYWGKREHAIEIKNMLQKQAGNRKGKNKPIPSTRHCNICRLEFSWRAESRCSECNRVRAMLYRAMMKDAGFTRREF